VLAIKLLKALPSQALTTALHRFTRMPSSERRTVPMVEMSMVALPTASGRQDAVGGAGVGIGGRGKHVAFDSKSNVIPVAVRTVNPLGAASSETPHCKYTVQVAEYSCELYVRKIPLPTC
jgi:hypothetical protein